MSKLDSQIPFVVKFYQPCISPEMKMVLLRFENDDGSMGCIGVHEESLESLCDVLVETLKKIKDFHDMEANVSNKVLECALTAQLEIL